MSEADFLEEEGPKGLRNSGLRCEVPESPLSEHRSESVDSGNHRRTSSISSLDLESTVAKKRAKDRLHELIKGALQVKVESLVLQTNLTACRLPSMRYTSYANT